MPTGENERLLGKVGFTTVAVEDTTAEKARVAQRRYEARAEHERELRLVEGDETYDGRQRFFWVAATLARERRLSRLVFVATKPA
jgi:hypothetical protein